MPEAVFSTFVSAALQLSAEAMSREAVTATIVFMVIFS
jgi:hypothetical protein